MIELGPWMPDLPLVRAPHLRKALGVLPGLEAYEPFQSIITNTQPLPARCIGATTARDITQASHIYAGAGAKLYELEGSTWTDRSKTGDYASGDNTRWRWTTYGDRLIGVNGLDEPQFIDMSTAATQFDDLPGAPSYSLIGTLSEFVLLAEGMVLKWSAFGDSEEWTPGIGQSDEQEFADGGRITALGSLDVAYIFQERAIRRMAYVGGQTIMQIDKIVDGIGCIEPNSFIQWGTMFFFLSEDGWYAFNGEQAIPIGTGADGGSAFDKWFQDNSQRSYWNRMSAGINPKRKLVAWAFASVNSSLPDYILFYNWVSKRATVVPYQVEIIISAASLGVSIDDLVGVDIDTMTISLDDPSFLGGAYYFAGFNSLHTLGSFTGDSVLAELETGDYALDKTTSSVEWFRAITDATTVTISGAGAMRPTSTPTFRGDVSMQSSGRCPQRGVVGNFICAKPKIPAGVDWTFISAIDFKAKKSGQR